MERTNFTKNINNMHKNLLKHSKKRREEKPQSLVKTIPNWLKMSQSAKGGWKEKIVKTFCQDLFSVDSGANNMVYDINLINWTNFGNYPRMAICKYYLQWQFKTF